MRNAGAFHLGWLFTLYLTAMLEAMDRLQTSLSVQQQTLARRAQHLHEYAM